MLFRSGPRIEGVIAREAAKLGLTPQEVREGYLCLLYTSSLFYLRYAIVVLYYICIVLHSFSGEEAICHDPQGQQSI